MTLARFLVGEKMLQIKKGRKLEGVQHARLVRALSELRVFNGTDNYRNKYTNIVVNIRMYLHLYA